MSEYRVQLSAFEGPLDLLLFLIRRAEVDITDIPIAMIAEQYIRFIRSAERVDIDQAGEFLVMAATLMEIKARTLAPPEDRPERGATPGRREEEDPRSELIRQLLEYKRIRDAAEGLHRRLREWEDRYPVAPLGAAAKAFTLAASDHDQAILDDLELIDLMQAFARIIETVDFNRLGEHRIVVDDTPIELHEQDILEHLRDEGSGQPSVVEFTRVFAGRTRAEAIGLFLALLELVRQRRVKVQQEPGESRIFLSAAPVADEGTQTDGSGVPSPDASASHQA